MATSSRRSASAVSQSEAERGVAHTAAKKSSRVAGAEPRGHQRAETAPWSEKRPRRRRATRPRRFSARRIIGRTERAIARRMPLPLPGGQDVPRRDEPTRRACAGGPGLRKGSPTAFDNVKPGQDIDDKGAKGCPPGPGGRADGDARRHRLRRGFFNADAEPGRSADRRRLGLLRLRSASCTTRSATAAGGPARTRARATSTTSTSNVHNVDDPAECITTASITARWTTLDGPPAT